MMESDYSIKKNESKMSTETKGLSVLAKYRKVEDAKKALDDARVRFGNLENLILKCLYLIDCEVGSVSHGKEASEMGLDVGEPYLMRRGAVLPLDQNIVINGSSSPSFSIKKRISVDYPSLLKLAVGFSIIADSSGFDWGGLSGYLSSLLEDTLQSSLAGHLKEVQVLEEKLGALLV